MLKINHFSKDNNNNFLFYSVLVFNLLLLALIKYYPSVDGPAHLYNSNVVFHLLRGNEFLEQFYSLNHFYIPNWFCHVLLSALHLVFPMYIAEKVLLFFYISGMALSFRFLIKTINPENQYLSVFIYPFIYSFLFHLGFLNYSFSFIFFFLSIGLWLRYLDSGKKIYWLLLFLTITISYFTNVLTFGFIGFTLGLYVLYFAYIDYCTNKQFKIAFKKGLKNMVLLLLIALPALIFLILFYKQVVFFPSENRYAIRELIKWINDARPFIVFDYNGEEIITEQYFHISIILVVISYLYTKNQKSTSRLLIQKKDILLLPLFLAILLLFIIPDGGGAGMMSDRFCLMLYIVGITWVVLNKLPKKPVMVSIVILISLHLGINFKHLNGTLRKLDKHAKEISNASNYIEENSIVLPVNISDSWVEPHFSNYLGVEKPLVILENYEANVGWFPVIWNPSNFPNIELNGKSSISGIQWISSKNSNVIKQIDYILLYGNPEKIDTQKWSEIKEQLSIGFKLQYKSEKNYVVLYKKLI